VYIQIFCVGTLGVGLPTISPSANLKRSQSHKKFIRMDDEEKKEETPDEEIPAAGQVGESDKGEELPVDEEE